MSPRLPGKDTDLGKTVAHIFSLKEEHATMWVIDPEPFKEPCISMSPVPVCAIATEGSVESKKHTKNKT